MYLRKSDVIYSVINVTNLSFCKLFLALILTYFSAYLYQYYRKYYMKTIFLFFLLTTFKIGRFSSQYNKYTSVHVHRLVKSQYQRDPITLLVACKKLIYYKIGWGVTNLILPLLLVLPMFLLYFWSSSKSRKSLLIFYYCEGLMRLIWVSSE